MFFYLGEIHFLKGVPGSLQPFTEAADTRKQFQKNHELIDYEFYSSPELEMEVSRVVPPEATLTHVEQEHQPVGQVRLYLQRYRTPVHERILRPQPGAVEKRFSPQFTVSYPARAEPPT